jgi:hypothetical protein
VAGQRASTTTQPQRRVMTKKESVLQMMMTAMKRVRVARAMVMAMRVTGNKEGKGGMGHGVGNEGGR